MPDLLKMLQYLIKKKGHCNHLDCTNCMVRMPCRGIRKQSYNLDKKERIEYIENQLYDLAIRLYRNLL